MAWVVVRDGVMFDEAALRAHARGRLPSYQVPQRFELVDDLPMNAGGKVLKTELRARSAAS